MPRMIVLASVIFGALLCVAIAVIVAVLSRRRAQAAVPRCGNCGYNLTGAPSNRCPECGQLFVEAGVITRQPTASFSRGATVVVVLILVGLTVLAALGTVMMGVRTRAARTRAAAASQAALQARVQAQTAAQQSTATAPAIQDHAADESPDAP